MRLPKQSSHAPLLSMNASPHGRLVRLVWLVPCFACMNACQMCRTCESTLSECWEFSPLSRKCKALSDVVIPASRRRRATSPGSRKKRHRRRHRHLCRRKRGTLRHMHAPRSTCVAQTYAHSAITLIVLAPGAGESLNWRLPSTSDASRTVNYVHVLFGVLVFPFGSW